MFICIFKLFQELTTSWQQSKTLDLTFDNILNQEKFVILLKNKYHD